MRTVRKLSQEATKTFSAALDEACAKRWYEKRSAVSKIWFKGVNEDDFETATKIDLIVSMTLGPQLNTQHNMCSISLYS